MITKTPQINLYIVGFVVGFVYGISENAELCLDCLENVAASRCTIPLCPLKSNCEKKLDLNNYKENIPDPKLVCRDESSLTFSWNRTTEKYYFMEYFGKQTRFTDLAQCGYLTINRLDSDRKYFLYLFGFSLDSLNVYKSKKILGQTSKSMVKRTPVVNLNYTLSLVDNLYLAAIKWEQGSDLSCLYEIMWYEKHEPGEYMQRRISLKEQLTTEFNLTDLEFGKTYQLSIISVDRNGDTESPKRRLKIVVPSCLDTYRNLSICPPNKPNLLVAETIPIQNGTSADNSYTNLKLNWRLPEHLPDYYMVSFVSSNNISNDSFMGAANISGDQNVAVLKNIGNYYIIKLVAYSKGGASSPAYIRKYPPSSSALPSNGTVSPKITVINTNAGNMLEWIWIGPVATVILLMVFAFRHKLKTKIMGYFFLEQKIDDPVVRYVTSEEEELRWELAESKLLIDEVIGCGAFGIVQKGYYYLEPNKKVEVAIKTLKANPSEDQISQFYDEIEIMKSVPRHAHIVYLIGVVTERRPSNPLMLVEYCSRGDLQSFLRRVALVLGDSDNSSGYKNLPGELEYDGTKFFNKSYALDTTVIMEDKRILESKDLLSFARQIAVGMEFLTNLKVIHRDLAARNVLVNEDNTLKISDFGLSRDVYTDNIYKKITGGKLPFKWMALESLTHQIYTAESDVWSFGIVLWEIVTLGANPYPAVNTQDLVALLKGGYRMEKPINCSEELYQIMLKCWQASPNLRPSFKELREIFDKLLESKMQYISLEDAKKLNLSHYENVKTGTMNSVADTYIVRGNRII